MFNQMTTIPERHKLSVRVFQALLVTPPGTAGMSSRHLFPPVIFMQILYDYWMRNSETVLTKIPGRCLSIFDVCFYNRQCSCSIHTAISSNSLLLSALKSGLAPRGLRAGTLTTCLLLFSGCPCSCYQDSIAQLFLVLTERQLVVVSQSFSPPSSMAMLWHTSRPSAILVIGKVHTPWVTATTLLGKMQY